MKTTYNVSQKKEVNKKNMLSFQQATSIWGLQLAEDQIKSANSDDVKDLTLNIISQVKTADLKTISNITEMIEAWSYNLNAYVWAEEVRQYCNSHKDILAAYATKFLNKTHLIIVVDDVTNDSVLEYNVFAFELRDNYKDIYDFMVVDRNSFDNLKDDFELCHNIYKRG